MELQMILKWAYDLGAGWGNGESQTYTNAADNIAVSEVK
jgi:hypothetical protein